METLTEVKGRQAGMQATVMSCWEEDADFGGYIFEATKIIDASHNFKGEKSDVIGHDGIGKEDFKIFARSVSVTRAIRPRMEVEQVRIHPCRHEYYGMDYGLLNLLLLSLSPDHVCGALWLLNPSILQPPQHFQSTIP